MGAWPYLFLAIASEVVATSALKQSEGLHRPLPAVVALAGYAVAFACLAQALRVIPLGVAYAIWSGVGIASLAVIGAIVYREVLSPVQVLGLVAVVTGVILLSVNR